MTDRPRIEDYALIGSLATSALVGRGGAIDWLPMMRFDAPSVFAALLGDAENGRWSIAPRETPRRIERRYLPGTLVLETTFHTDSGSAQLVDFMPISEDRGEHVVRIVRGLRGSVPMRFDVRFRFDYGRDIPWVRRRGNHHFAVAGPNAVRLSTPLELEPEDFATVCSFEIREGDGLPAVLTCYRSFQEPPATPDAEDALRRTVDWWQSWTSRCATESEWQEAVERSAITLKALTHRETGGGVAAATTSLPERIGGVRNWDYRYCWLRDATFTLYALSSSGYHEEAKAWREWLRRAVAGEPAKLQIMYGLGGERRLDERELPWLDGYGDSRPVRIGNDAHRQKQLDVYGEVMDAFHSYRTHELENDDEAWRIELELMPYLEEHWRDPDAGIWERRGDERRYVTSRVMCWVAVDRAVKGVEQFGLDGPVERWRKLRQEIHDEICRDGYDERKGAFVQEIGGDGALDASALLIPLVGFLPPDDERVVNTVEAIRSELGDRGFIYRYDTGGDDGLPAGEGSFIACTLWLADALALMGRKNEAREIFQRVLDVRNDVGLLAEEYDPVADRQLGNFPQAFSHVGVINTARNLARSSGPAHHRAEK